MFLTRLIRVCVVLLVGFACLSTVSATEHIEQRLAKQTELPFQLYNNIVIVVKGSIGSIKDLNIILDTGTSPTTVSKVIADRFDLRGNAEWQLTLTGMVKVQSVILPRIQMGGLYADSVIGVVQDLSFLDQKLGIPIGGIAGLDVLSGRNFTIDYRKRKIIFKRLATSKSIHFEKRASFLTVKAKIEGHEVRLLVDSGTPGLIIYRNRFEPRVKRRYSEALVETATGMTQSQWFLASSVSLANENLGRRAVVIADPYPAEDDFDGVLGFVDLGFHRVVFDFDNGLLGWD
jgi:predicted aspartyl protease